MRSFNFHHVDTCTGRKWRRPRSFSVHESCMQLHGVNPARACCLQQGVNSRGEVLGSWRPCHERCHQGLRAVRMMQDLLGHCDAHELHRIRLFTHDEWRTLLLGVTNRVAYLLCYRSAYKLPQAQNVGQCGSTIGKNVSFFR
jgi:hypothetical protein